MKGRAARARAVPSALFRPAATEPSVAAGRGRRGWLGRRPGGAVAATPPSSAVESRQGLTPLARLDLVNDVSLAVPLLGGPVHRVKSLLCRRVHLDDFEHAGQIAGGVEIDDAKAHRRGIGKRLGVSKRT